MGLLGAKWGRCTKNPTEIPPHTPQDEQLLHRPTPSGLAINLPLGAQGAAAQRFGSMADVAMDRGNKAAGR